MRLKQKLFALAILMLTGIWSSLFAQAPDWSVNPLSYTYSLSLTGKVVIDGNLPGSANDKLAAFVDGECRGVASPEYDASSNQWLVFLPAYSSSNTDTLSFKYYQESNDSIYEMDTELPFIPDQIYGSPYNPRVIANVAITEADLISFEVPGQLYSEIMGDTVFITFPDDLDKTALVANYETSPGANVKVGTNMQFSGISANDFTNVVNYTITSGDGETVNNYYVKLAYHTMTINATVFIDGMEFNSLQDKLYAYINGRMNDESSVMMFAPIQKRRFQLQLQHHSAIDEISFKFFDYDLNDTIELSQSLEFVSGTSIGTRYNPIVLSEPVLTGKELISFNIDGQIMETRYEGNDVIVKMPLNADLSSLTPTFTTSPGAIVELNDSVQYSGISTNDYTYALDYKVWASNRSSYNQYRIKVVYHAMDIIASVFINQEEITGENDTLYAYIDDRLSGFITPTHIPEIEKYRFDLTVVHYYDTGNVSFKYYNALNNQTYDLLNDVDFVDDTEIGSFFNPEVLFDMDLTENEITEYEIFGQYGATEYSGDTMLIRMQGGTDVSALISYFEASPGAIVTVEDSVQYSEFTTNDFANPVNYTVYSGNRENSRNYTVIVDNVGMNITASVFVNGGEITGENDKLYAYINGVLSGQAEAVYYPEVQKYRYNLHIMSNDTDAVVSFKYLNTENNQMYDLITTVDYMEGTSQGDEFEPVVLANTVLQGTEMLAFMLPGQIGNTLIENNEVRIKVPFNFDADSLIPTYLTSPGAFVKVNDSIQYSEINENDFTDTLIYQVIASDYSDTADYPVYLTKYYSNITAKVYLSGTETANAEDTLYAYINNELAYQITPTYVQDIDKYRFELQPRHYFAEGVIDFKYFSNESEQIHNLITQVDFAHESSKGTLYNPITLSNTDLTEAEIISFSIPGQIRETKYFGNQIFIKMPLEIGFEGLTPNFELTEGARAYLNDSIQYSAFTSNNYIEQAEYMVVSGNNSDTNIYEINVVHFTGDIMASVFIGNDEQTGNSGQDTLFAYIENRLSGFAVAHEVTEINKFRFDLNIVHYHDTGSVNFVYQTADTSYALYNIVDFEHDMSKGTDFNPIVLSTEVLEGKDILTYNIPGQVGTTRFAGTEITVKLPQDMDLTALTPEFTNSPGAIVELTDSVQYSGFTTNDFSNTLTYTVYNAARTDSQIYTVNAVQYYMDVTATVFIQGQELGGQGDSLIAFIGNEETLAQNLWIDDISKNRFKLHIANYDETAVIAFKVKPAGSSAFIELENILAYQAGTSEGTEFNPVILSAPLLTDCDLLTFSLPIQRGETERVDSIFKIIVDPDKSLLDVAANFTISTGAKMFINDSIQYSDFTENDFENKVIVRVESSTGACSKYYTIETIISRFDNLESSSILSPNGDGKNDYWILKDSEKYRESEVFVFDSKGQVVYESIGYENNWDGQYQGSMLPVGTYYYVIKSQDGTVNKGVISLIY